jgi:hypothetical protein
MKNVNESKTRLDEMYKADILERSKISSKVENSGWNLLPAISSFDLTLSDFNALLEKVGLERRMENEIKTKGHSNHKMNRYARFIVRRARRALLEEKNPKKFWHIAWFVIDRSVTFRVMAVNHISKNWYKNKPLSYVMNILRKVDKIIKERMEDIDFKRVYIPKKPEDAEKLMELLKRMRLQETRKLINWRGLGVPQESWRIYLHMLSNFMTMFTEGAILPTQHAYQPGKGTTTAMSDVLERVKKYKYIYEVDFKGCFPSINIHGIIDKLLELGMEPEQVMYMERLNLSSPKKAKYEMMDEWAEDAKRKANAWRKEVGDIVYVKKKHKDSEGYIIPGSYTLVPKYLPAITRMSHVGLPQGSPLSPILTILGLDKWTREAGEDRVFYADDGIIFSNKPIELKSDPYAGINIHEGKSGYVKYAGVWQKTLYFVGMLYNGWTDMISGHTRNGSRLNIERESENLFELLREIKPDYEWNISQVFKNTSLGGVITACLYNGKWGKVNTKDPDPESLYGIKGSWIDSKGRTAHKAQTSSDAVRALAQILRAKWSNDRREKVKLGAKKIEKIAVFRKGRWIHINKDSNACAVQINIRPNGVWMRLNPLQKMTI